MGEVVPLQSPDCIDPQTDALVGRIEAGGLNFYVMETRLETFLSFEFGRPAPTPQALSDAIAAAQTLARLMRNDAAFRERMVAHALSVGAFYRPV